MGLLERLRRRFTETDEERLAGEIQAWASGAESLEAVITDGTGEIAVIWMGRRAIPGLTLGTHVVVEGVAAAGRAGRKMVNPKFEFAA
jgi:hypothetical protein